MTLDTAAASTPSGSLVGRVIDGRYRLEEEIGSGIAGTTYRARRTEDSRLVVLKLFDEDVSSDPVRRSRFEWEAATLAGLAHPNVVPILDYGVFAGRRYLVSEWLEGESLAVRMRRAQLPLTAAVGIIRQVLAALASVHGSRLAHRNLKPTDVYLEYRKQGRERVKLLDFAPVIRPARGKLTAAGRGSYVPPELVEGEALDARSDVYAVGALLSGMLHGGPPDTPVLAGPVASGSRKGPVVDSTLQGWIRRAMARDRQERFADAAEMLQQLIDLLPRDLRSPPESYEATRSSSVSIPAPVRAEPRRSETARSQVLPSSALPTSVPPEPAPEPVRTPSQAPQTPSARVSPVVGASESVSPETRAAFAKSERARQFIENKAAKSRDRKATPTQRSILPSDRPSRAETTSAGWVVAEPPRVERSSAESGLRRAAPPPAIVAEPPTVAASPIVDELEPSALLIPPEALEPPPLPRAEHVELTVAALEAAALVAAADLVTIEPEPAPVARDLPAEVAAAPAPSAPKISTAKTSAAAPQPTAAAPVAATPERPRAPTAQEVLAAAARSERTRIATPHDVPAAPARAAEPTAPTIIRTGDATGSMALERHHRNARGAHGNRPPNRRARRDAARRAAMLEREATGATVTHDPASAKDARSENGTAKVAKHEHVRPQTKDEGSVRDAVVGGTRRWLTRVSRNATFSPALGHASLVGAGIVCVLAFAAVGLKQLESRPSRGAGPGTVETAVDSTASRPAVRHEAIAAPKGEAKPETTVDPATAPSEAEPRPSVSPASTTGRNARVPAINPWADPLPPDLEGIPELANKGDHGSDETMARLRIYSRLNEGDARGFLLMGRFYMNRYWRSDALTAFQMAIERDPAVRGAPEIMASLIEFIVTGKNADKAEEFITRIYGREALPPIELALERLQKPLSIQRLSAVRSKLLDREH